MEKYIIAYDIADDKRRYRAFKTIKEYATPVQFSLFESNLTKSDILKLKHRLKTIINEDEDSMIFYRQCANCKDSAERMGKSNYVYGDEDVIV